MHSGEGLRAGEKGRRRIQRRNGVRERRTKRVGRVDGRLEEEAESEQEDGCERDRVGEEGRARLRWCRREITPRMGSAKLVRLRSISKANSEPNP